MIRSGREKRLLFLFLDAKNQSTELRNTQSLEKYRYDYKHYYDYNLSNLIIIDYDFHGEIALFSFDLKVLFEDLITGCWQIATSLQTKSAEYNPAIRDKFYATFKTPLAFDEALQYLYTHYFDLLENELKGKYIKSEIIKQLKELLAQFSVFQYEIISYKKQVAHKCEYSIVAEKIVIKFKKRLELLWEEYLKSPAEEIEVTCHSKNPQVSFPSYPFSFFQYFVIQKGYVQYFETADWDWLLQLEEGSENNAFTCLYRREFYTSVDLINKRIHSLISTAEKNAFQKEIKRQIENLIKQSKADSTLNSFTDHLRPFIRLKEEYKLYSKEEKSNPSLSSALKYVDRSADVELIDKLSCFSYKKGTNTIVFFKQDKNLRENLKYLLRGELDNIKGQITFLSPLMEHINYVLHQLSKVSKLKLNQLADKKYKDKFNAKMKFSANGISKFNSNYNKYLTEGRSILPSGLTEAVTTLITQFR